MPIYTVEIDGKQYDIEGDRPPSEQEARSAVGVFAAAQGGGPSSSAPRRAATPPPPQSTIGMMQPSTMQGDPGWAARNMKPEMAQALSQYTEDDVMAEPIGPSPASVIAGARGVPGILARGLGISKARAGQNIQGALEAAKDVRVPSTTLQPVIDRAGELVAAGTNRSQVITKLSAALKKSQDSSLSAQEAQDFVSNASRMSAAEFSRLSPVMQRQVSELSAKLRQALTESLNTVGKGEQYTKGVKEYARASKAAKHGKQAAKWGGGLVGADFALRRLRDASNE